MIIKLKCLAEKIPFVAVASKKIVDLRNYYRFKRDFNYYKSLSDSHRSPIRWKDRYPCLNDRTSTTSFDRHYVFHTAWAARVLARTFPKEHVDISSSLYFVSLVSAFVPIQFYDYRPADFNLSRLQSDAAELLALPFPDASVSSISCMHVVEHVGLGRYGDPIDPEGDLKAIAELKRVLAEGGNMLFVVPIGQPKVMFNAHRIYSYDQIMSYFGELELMEFALIPDNAKVGGLIEGATKKMADAQTYGCGCFWFTKKAK